MIDRLRRLLRRQLLRIAVVIGPEEENREPDHQEALMPVKLKPSKVNEQILETCRMICYSWALDDAKVQQWALDHADPSKGIRALDAAGALPALIPGVAPKQIPGADGAWGPSPFHGAKFLLPGDAGAIGAGAYPREQIARLLALLVCQTIELEIVQPELPAAGVEQCG